VARHALLAASCAVHLRRIALDNAEVHEAAHTSRGEDWCAQARAVLEKSSAGKACDGNGSSFAVSPRNPSWGSAKRAGPSVKSSHGIAL